MAKWLAKEFDWDTGKYTGNYYDIAEAGIVAVFVDSFFGNDSNAGTAAAPYKTLGAAITYLNANGANGSRIFMNGIFSENLPAQTYWYEFIGCGGGWNGRTLFNYDQIGGTKPTITKSSARFIHIETINYSDTLFFVQNVSGVLFCDCFIKNCILGQTGNVITCTFFDCITYKCAGVRMTFNSYLSIFYDWYASDRVFTSTNLNNHFYECDFGNSSTGNQLDTEGQYINVANNDFNVRITSPLIGAGLVDEITGIAANVGGVEVGLPYNGITPEFTTAGGATITDLTIDANGGFTITAPATTGTLETALMDLGNIYPLENIDLFNVFDFAAGEITQGVFEDFVSPRMALTIKLKYGLTEAEVTECPWLLIEYGKQPTFSGTGASRVGNADATFDPDTFQEITCRYMKLFVTLQNNS